MSVCVTQTGNVERVMLVVMVVVEVVVGRNDRINLGRTYNKSRYRSLKANHQGNSKKEVNDLNMLWDAPINFKYERETKR